MNLAVDHYLAVVINSIVPEQTQLVLRRQQAALKAFQVHTHLAYCHECQTLAPRSQFCVNCGQHVCDKRFYECDPCQKEWCSKCSPNESSTCQICQCSFCNPGCGGEAIMISQCCGKIMCCNCYAYSGNHECFWRNGTFAIAPN